MIWPRTRFALWLAATIAGFVALKLNYVLGGHDETADLVILVIGLANAAIASIPRKIPIRPAKPVYFGVRETVTETEETIS